MADLSNKKSVIQNIWRSTENISRILDNSPDSMFVSRVDNFVFVEVNMRAIKNYGYSLEEFLEMNIFDIEVETPLETEVRRLYDNTPVGEVIEVEGVNRRKDGSTFPVHVRFCKLDEDYAVANVRDITLQKEVAFELERRMAEIEVLRRFEHALSDISTAFINFVADKVVDQIEMGLATAGQALNADLITLLQPSHDDGFVVKYEWTSERRDRKLFKGVHVSQQFPWLADRLLQNETIRVSAISDFPAEATEERTAMEQAGLESFIMVPFDVRGVSAGYIAINRVRSTTWPEELVPRLRLLGEVFGEALSRRDAELKLRSLKQIELRKEQLQQENLYLRETDERTFSEIIGESGALREVLTKVEQVAMTDSTVLILGETGTGKELIARAIHDISSRKDRIMIKVNCAALPSGLVEAELFGREKGAYTGALTRELGRFEIADGSTIFLDEIGELSLELQAKLLRVLQDGEFERLGSTKTRKVDVRVLAATNRDLAKAVENKEFRADLFYRLNVFPILIPPLRDRVEDIPKLVWAFVQEFSEAMGKTIESIPVTAMDSLKEYAWPGNIREVRNIIERAMIISKGPLLEVDLQEGAATAGRSKRLADVEREHIQAVVQATGWRIRGAGGAAEILGLKATTLEARMKKLGIQRTSTR